ncbi:MAG: hypothetical protein H5U32_03925 [Pseudomonas balearica]|uniref:hypothetical protein n=1 Tax=Stutzerimonas balearica TaxID=74829 RepID=UPI0019950060|nr:hypothetical protein [Stutzerimonas balearica]MBC7198380.1 hypothetical protein [Stutzerimonas balearica]
MKEKILLVGFVLSLLSQAAQAYAEQWHWEVFGANSYSGQIPLRDDQNQNLNYQRYNSAQNPQLFGSVSVQSPIMVVAGTDIDIQIVRSGVAVTKPTCNSPKTPAIYVSPVTVCNFGVGTSIAGINAYAVDNGTTYTPKLDAWFQGYGWRSLDGTNCGRVEVKMLCQ